MGSSPKSHDPEDGRGTIVAITDEGFALFRRVAFTHMDAIDRHVGHALDEVELRDLIELCDRLRRGVGGQADASQPAADDAASDA